MCASARAARMQRRTPSGLGAVMLPPPRWPPQFTATPTTSHLKNHPQSPPGAQNARRRVAHRARGPLRGVIVSPAEHAHGIEAGPDVMTRTFRTSAEHALG